MQAHKSKEAIDAPRKGNPYSILGSSTRDEILDLFGGCRLCWAADEQGQRDPLNRILLETEDFVLLPALGAFVTGCVLLVSKEHKPPLVRFQSMRFGLSKHSSKTSCRNWSGVFLHRRGLFSSTGRRSAAVPRRAA